VRIKNGSLRFKKTGLAGTGEVLPQKNVKKGLDFLLVLWSKFENRGTSQDQTEAVAVFQTG